MLKPGVRTLICISLSQFGAAIAFYFVTVFLPFYASRISPYNERDTLLWIGAIMGSTGIALALTAPVWGSFAHRYPPKWLYLGGMLFQTAMTFLMGLLPDVHALLVLRILQGMAGGISTIGLIIISASSPAETLPFRIGVFQSALTFGQLVGPPVGTLGVSALGYSNAFLAASGMLCASALFCHLYVTPVPPLPRERKTSGRSFVEKRTIAAWMLSLTATIQLMFLPSILPNILQGFRLEHDPALRWAGFMVMLYMASAMAGTYLWGWMSRRLGVKTVISFLVPFGILFQWLLILCNGVVSFTIVFMLVAGCAAPVIPLVMAIFAAEQKGSLIGLLNSARFVGGGIGPFIATALLAFSSLPALHITVGCLTLLAFLGFMFSFRGSSTAD